MCRDYSYEYCWDRRYCYPNFSVLINKLNIKSADSLAEAEREITSLKKVITATRFPLLNKHGGYFVKLYQQRSYVLALKERRM